MANIPTHHEGITLKARAFVKKRLNAVENIELTRLSKRVKSVVTSRPSRAIEGQGKSPQGARFLKPLRRLWTKITDNPKADQPQDAKSPEDTHGPFEIVGEEETSTPILTADQREEPRFLPVTEPVCLPDPPMIQYAINTGDPKDILPPTPEPVQPKVLPSLPVTEPVQLPASSNTTSPLSPPAPRSSLDTSLPPTEPTTAKAVATKPPAIRSRSLTTTTPQALHYAHPNTYSKTLPNRRFASERYLHVQTTLEAVKSVFAAARTPSERQRFRIEYKRLCAIFAQQRLRQRRAAIPAAWRCAPVYTRPMARRVAEAATMPGKRMLVRADSAAAPFRTVPRGCRGSGAVGGLVRNDGWLDVERV
ncbi:hypothetical protein CC86DRAFT_379346 [Ophiobolus disseminans]|uniref:Uncharacterized protein n=1 Tax=Ophiobolus disseminans TaxID=1469910 RepID=A0A6A7AB66_9PLEO|nr:hypothetical protein CC86DRAFT_379346 [Ophiobolus disseminans]